MGNYTPSILIQLPNEQYQAIMARKFTLERAISHIALTLAKYVAVHKISGDINLKYEGFCILVRTSQKYFLVRCPRNVAVSTVGDIKVATRRRTTDLQSETHLPIVNSSDHNLLWKAIRRAHVDKNENKIHYFSDRTTARLNEGPYAIFSPKSNLSVRLYTAGCGKCNLALEKPVKHKTGRRKKGVEGMEGLYTSTCLDTLPFKISQAMNSRYIRKVYILVTVDLFSGHTSTFVIDDLSAKAIATAIFALQAHMGVRIKNLYSDNASYFGTTVLNQMDLDRLRVEVKKL